MEVVIANQDRMFYHYMKPLSAVLIRQLRSWINTKKGYKKVTIRLLSRVTNCPSLPVTEGFPGIQDFSAKTGKVLGKLGPTGHPNAKLNKIFY